MSTFHRWGAAALVAMVSAAVPLAGCRGPLAGGDPSAGGAARPRSGFTVIRNAESGPITALVYQSPYVWAGTERGLRRWKVAAQNPPQNPSEKSAQKPTAVDLDGDAEWVGGEAGLLGHHVSALGADSQGGVWVATEAGVGRLVSEGAHPRYQAKGALAGISWLAPTGDDGAWAGGAAGLYRFDGRSWTVIDFLHEVPVTSLDLDADGTTAWVGTRGRGLYRVDQRGGAPMAGSDSAEGRSTDASEVVGTAVGSSGARVVAVHGAPASAGEGRGVEKIIFLTQAGAQSFHTQPDAGLRFVRLVGGSTGGEPVLVAGAAAGEERLFTLRPLPRGESPPAGGFRLLASRKGAGERYAAVPSASVPPPDITAVAPGRAGEIWFGSRAMGVSRAAAERPAYLTGDLSDDADRCTVACAARDRCYVVAGGAHAWLFDGSRFREARAGETADGRALAVVTDRAGAIFGVSSEPQLAGLELSRLAAGGAGADRWQPVERVPLGSLGGRAGVSFATFSPDGKLWLGLTATDADGQERGLGALEISLVTHETIHHGAPDPRHPDPESLPLPHDVTGVLFDGAATWFSSRSGMSRWQESELRHWGENEHMSSEVCHGVDKGSDGKVWAATSAGVARFDGKQWLFGDADGPAAVVTRALARDPAGRVWLATARGLRVLTAQDAAAPQLAPGDRVLDDQILDVTVDRYGRIWALGRSGLAIVEAVQTP
jgi:hypothetical protein